MSAYNGILHNVLPAAAENMNQEERDAQGGFNRGSLVRSSSNNGSGMGLGGQQDQQQLLSLFHQKLTKNTVKELKQLAKQKNDELATLDKNFKQLTLTNQMLCSHTATFKKSLAGRIKSMQSEILASLSSSFPYNGTVGIHVTKIFKSVLVKINTRHSDFEKIHKQRIVEYTNGETFGPLSNRKNATASSIITDDLISDELQYDLVDDDAAAAATRAHSRSPSRSPRRNDKDNNDGHHSIISPVRQARLAITSSSEDLQSITSTAVVVGSSRINKKYHMNDYYSGNLSSPFPDHHDNGDTILLMPTSSSSSSSYSSTSSNSNSPPDDGDVIINNDDEFGATSGDHCPVQILLDREYASVILPLLLALRKKTLLKRARIAYCTTLLSTKLANDELDAKR